MINDRPTADAPSPLLPFFLIWGSLLTSQALIVLMSQTAVVGVHLARLGEQVPASLVAAQIPQGLFIALGVFFLAAAYFSPRLFMKGVRDSFASRSTEPSFKEIAEKSSVGWILRWILLEAVTLMGFMSSMLYGEPTAIYPFAAASLVCFALTVPSEQKIRSGLANSN